MKSGGATAEELQAYLIEHSQYRAQYLGDADEGEICCGQVAGMIEGLDTAGEVMKEIVKSVPLLFDALKRHIDGFSAG